MSESRHQRQDDYEQRRDVSQPGIVQEEAGAGQDEHRASDDTAELPRLAVIRDATGTKNMPDHVVVQTIIDAGAAESAGQRKKPQDDEVPSISQPQPNNAENRATQWSPPDH